MSKKLIVGLIIFLFIVIMIADFKINGVRVFESFYRHLETESIRRLQQGKFNLSYQGPSANVEIDDQVINLDSNINILDIENPMGSIDIIGEDRQDILLSYKITVYAVEQEIADTLVKKLKITSEKKGKRLALDLIDMETHGGVYGIKIDYNLIVPEELVLDIENRYGRLKVSKMTGDISLRNFYDEMDVRNISGKADLYARYGNVYAKDIDGQLQLDSAYNSIDISRVNNDLYLEQNYGQGRIDSIEGDSVLNCTYGSIYFAGISGNVKLNSKYTQVRGEDFEGDFNGELSYGHLDLSDISNNLVVDARYTELEVDLSEDMDDYQVYCKTEYGNINTNLPFEVKKDNNKKSIEGEKGNGRNKINLISDHADINIYN